MKVAWLWVLLSLLGGCPGPLRYDTIVQKGGHNSYARKESLFDQLVYHRVRSFELDIWNTSEGYVVKHGSRWTDPGRNCPKLRDCLATFAAFDRAVPDHEVVTVWLEPKAYENGPDTAIVGDELDQLLAEYQLGLFTPADLITACPEAAPATTIAQAARNHCFPAPSALRGRFIFVLFDGPGREDRALSDYLGGKPARDRSIFLGARLPLDPTRTYVKTCPDCFAFAGNASAADVGLGVVMRERVQGEECEDERPQGWAAAVARGASHLGSNCINAEAPEMAWARTHTAHGYPFRCPGDQCKDAVEVAELIGIRAATGDLWSRADDFVLATAPTSSGETWQLTAYVSAAGSHVAEWAKGCVMARASLDRDAAYFAVCRPAAEHPMRVQYRELRGGETRAEDLPLDPAMTPAFATLHAVRRGARTCFVGGSSRDGLIFTMTTERCLDGAFPLRGLAASSHGPDAVTFLFGDLRAQPVSPLDQRDLTLHSIGGVTVARLFGPAWD